PVETVAPEEPLERAPCPDAVLGVVGDRKGGQLGLDERGGIEGLLVARARSRFAVLSTVMAGKPEHVACETALVAQPAQRIQASLDHVVASERVSSGDERLGEARVVVAELALEPLPVA